MPGVILILGLVAAGVYTGSGWFYLAAGLLGSIYLIVTALVASIFSVATKELKKQNARRRF